MVLPDAKTSWIVVSESIAARAGSVTCERGAVGRKANASSDWRPLARWGRGLQCDAGDDLAWDHGQRPSPVGHDQ